MDDKLIGKLRTGQTATFIIFQTPEEGIGFPMSLAGLRRGLRQAALTATFRFCGAARCRRFYAPRSIRSWLVRTAHRRSRRIKTRICRAWARWGSDRLVPRLMAAGHAVTGWNRSRDKAEPLIEAGMPWADTPRAVAEQSEIVFSIVTDAKAVRAVALGQDGIIAGHRQGRHLHRHEHDRAGRKPRGRRRVRQGRRDHARRAALRQPGDRDGKAMPRS